MNIERNKMKKYKVILISLIIITVGIYLINKKVLKGNI